MLVIKILEMLSFVAFIFDQEFNQAYMIKKALDKTIRVILGDFGIN